MLKNTRIFRVGNLLVLLTIISGLMMIPNQSAQGLPSGVSDYFIPTTSQQVFSIFVDNDNNPALDQAQGMRYVIGVTAYVDNTTLFYDHWEDGYDFNETDFSNADETYSATLAGGVMNFVSFNVPVPRAAAPTANQCLWRGWLESKWCIHELLRWWRSYLYRRRRGGYPISLA